ncbi:hypothetical protein Dimus_006318 [Dionaea muscipula]
MSTANCVSRIPVILLRKPRQLQLGLHNSFATRYICSSSASSSPSSYSSSNPRKLVLYSKPGCCLCDGLKEKLSAAFSLSVDDPLQDVQLEVRDITSNPEWERAYQYEIPVLAKVLSDGTECVNKNGSDISKCQFYLDMLDNCNGTWS